jgi:hypothetical protein
MRSFPKNLAIVIIVISIIAFALAAANASGESQNVNSLIGGPSEPNIVDINVAILAAQDYLPYYYPGDWQYFDRFVCYDINGLPAAYAIVFCDPNGRIRDVNQLQSAISSLRQKHQDVKERLQARLMELQTQDANADDVVNSLRKEESKLIRSQYFTGTFATVMTGAVETEPVVIRCYRGLPDFLVKQQEIEELVSASFSAKKLRTGRLVYFSPVDIRFEVTGDVKTVQVFGRVAGKPVRPNRQVFSDGAYVLAYKGESKGFQKLGDERQKGQQLKERKSAELAKMKKEDREHIEQGMRAAEEHNAKNWAEYKTKHLNEESQQNKEDGK